MIECFGGNQACQPQFPFGLALFVCEEETKVGTGLRHRVSKTNQARHGSHYVNTFGDCALGRNCHSYGNELSHNTKEEMSDFTQTRE